MLTRRTLLPLAAALALPGRALAAGPTTLALGSHPRQAVDVYDRPGLKDAPVLLFVHGGGWSIGDKRGVNALPAYAERHGLLLVACNYRLAPEVDAGGCAQDVASAIFWLTENAAKYGGDPKRIFVAGHSAGAHLAALVAVDPRYLGQCGVRPSDIAGVIPIDGAGYDAVSQMRYLGDGPGMLAGMYRNAFGTRAAELSPTLLVQAGQAYPPFLIFHVASRPDAQRQSQGLADALRAAGGQAEVVAAPGETHRTINVDFGKAGDPEGERAAVFIRG
ncbi:MAG: alpha/beta hydrolase [Caulobacter sp.]|nr:alpha/beta hydrolase [Caulobacter sp.]